MADFNENLDKAKSFVESTAKKAQESEIYNKVSEAASNATQRIKENEKVAGAVDKINQTEIAKKVNKSKYAKFIKIGIAVVAVVLVVNIIFFIFSDKKAKQAQKTLESEIITMLEEGGATKHSISSKAIGKNADACLYAFDTTVKYTANNHDYTSTAFYIVYCDDKESYTVDQLEYQNENKNEIKDITIGKLARG